MASPEDALDLLDAPGRIRVVVWQGRRHALPDPASMSWREVVEALEDPRMLYARVPAVRGAGAWRWSALQHAWAEAFDLGDPQRARRLAYLMARHSSVIEADFARWYPGTSPHALWRSREWRRLLNLIDHLPQNTHYHHAISQDEEHAKMIIDAEDAARKRGEEPTKPGAPSMSSWSPEVAVLTSVLDAVRENTYATVKAAGDGKGGGSPPKPSPRPLGVLDRVRLRMRQQRHDILVRRMLPHKFSDDDQ